jgi:hypothetical protein
MSDLSFQIAAPAERVIALMTDFANARPAATLSFRRATSGWFSRGDRA